MEQNVAQATLRFLRMSPRKVRLIADMVRGLPVDTAVAQLGFSLRAASRPVRKLIESAAANAEHNKQMYRPALYIQAITVDDGPTYKRFTPRAHGRATPIRKRTSHVCVTLAEREGVERVAGTTAAKAPKKEKKEAEQEGAGGMKGAPKKTSARSTSEGMKKRTVRRAAGRKS